MRLLRVTFTGGAFSALLLLLSIQTAHAGSATWSSFPSNDDWNDPTNWTAGGPPNGPSDTATFSASSETTITISENTEVSGIVFDAAASPFTIDVHFIPGGQGIGLSISGAGITNNSGASQNFLMYGTLDFQNSASAGSSTIFTAMNNIVFFDTSTAANGTFINKGDDSPFGGRGQVVFYGGSTASNGTFTSNGAVIDGGIGGFVMFDEDSTAANGTFTSNGGAVSGAFGGHTQFAGASTAGNSTIIANGGEVGSAGGEIEFFNDSVGGTARVEVFGNGFLDISFHGVSGVTIGSIEGNGLVFLGAINLTVGSNNLSTTFSGVTQDGGLAGGSGGSLTKIGTGTLTLSGANIYTGNTTISAGTLLIKTKPSSGTGSGKVKLNGGTLGGTGTIGGAVTVGKGNGPGAFLSPGINGPGTLTLKKTLTFKLDGTYKCELKNSNARVDKIVAKGVSINSGALFSFVGLGSGALAQGTIFTVISNTATTPITGTFSNLPDGSTFNANGNNFQVNYEGGTGNDLTLTVAP